MPLIFIHGPHAEQSTHAGTAQRFSGMLSTVRERVALPATFEVRTPRWRELGGRVEQLSAMVPYELSLREAGTVVVADPLDRLLDLYGGDQAALVRVLQNLAMRDEIPQEERAALAGLLSSDLRRAYDHYLTLPRVTASTAETQIAGSAIETRKRALSRLGALVQRAVDSTIAAGPALHELYANMEEALRQLMGDALSYVAERERYGAASPILRSILVTLPERSSATDPLIVVSCATGSTVFFDLLTTMRPELRVTCWITVASQLAQLHRAGLLAYQAEPHASALANDVESLLKGRVHHWYNVYDPLDPLSGAAATSFNGVIDIPYRAGRGPLCSHLQYFRDSRLYRLLAEQIVESLTS